MLTNENFLIPHKEYDLGNIVRKVREENGFSLKTVSQKINCTDSALSKFELKNKSLGKKKIALLLKLLNIKADDFPSILERIEEEQYVQVITFLAIENQIKRKKITLFRQLNEKIKKHQLKQPIMKNFLTGKFFIEQKDYDSAREYFRLVVDANDDEYCPRANLKASAFLDLGAMSYKRHDFITAMKHLEEAKQCFNPRGERRHVWHGIHYNKAMIFYELGKRTERSESDWALEPAWKERDSMPDEHNKIKVYRLKASIKRNSEKYKEARNILHDALQIATVNRLSDATYYVMVDLAKLAISMNQTEYSERCFLSALDMEDDLKKTKPTSAYLGLGKLYLQQGDYKKAKKRAKTALKHAKSSDDIHLLIQVHITLAEIFEKDGKKQDAQKNYDLALAVAKEYKLDQYKPELYDSKFRCTN